MGRPSKLTEKQWAEIERRMVEGESARSLAKEFGVSDTAIRLRVSSQVEEIKAVANQILATESRLKAMPITSQVTTHNLADTLRSISGHLAGAANYGAATAHRLSGIAHGKVMEIDDAAPVNEESMSALKSIAALTHLANESANIGLNLIKANKDAVDSMNKRDEPQADMNMKIEFIGA